MGCRAGQGPFSATVRREWDVKDLRRCGRLGEPSLPAVPDAHARRASTAIRDYSPPLGAGSRAATKRRVQVRNPQFAFLPPPSERGGVPLQNAIRTGATRLRPAARGLCHRGGLENAGRQIKA